VIFVARRWVIRHQLRGRVDKSTIYRCCCVFLAGSFVFIVYSPHGI
jgi:hypothetical protein